LVLAWSLPARAYDLGRPMGLYPPGGAPALAMLDSRIEITVRGPILETVVVQRFRNAGARATEATYIFPLPADAAVSAMAMKIGTRTIRAAIEIREAAQRRYEAAIAAGVAGTLLEQERPDVFTQNVSAIPPGGVVEVTLRYDSVARYESGRWELVLPMVVAPRHVPGTASGRATTGSGRAPDTDRAPDASRVTPGGSPGAGGATAVAIHFIDPPSELASPTHELGGTRGDATLSDPHSDHDAIVRWRAPAPAAGWVERDGDAGFAAVVVEAPPPAARKGAVRVILAIDRAATTRGDGDAVEHPLIRALCGALDPADQVRVIGSNELAWNPPGEVLRALERAWATPAPVFDLTRVLERAHPDGAAIVLVSDGLVADDQAAIAAAQRLGGPVHVIGIGPAPARATLQQIAAAGGGTVRYAVAGDDVAALARAVVGDIAGPPAPLTINWGTLGASDIEPAVLPRLGAGQAMLALARIKRVQAANARTRGELFAFESLAAPRTVDGATTPRGPLARRWAHERLRDLLAAGRDRTTVVDHALRYGLVSPHTSLVAIGSDVVVSGGVKHSVAVPVSVPSGMNWRAVQQAIDPDTALEPGPAPGNAPVPPRPEPAPPAPEPQPARTTPPAKTAPPATKAPPTRGGPSGKHRPSPKAGAEGAEGDTRPRKNKKDSGGAASGDAVSDREGRKFDAKEGVANAPPAPAQAGPAADDDEEKPRRAEQRLATAAPPAETAEEMISLEGSTLRSSGRTLRLTAALGGGLAFDRGARGLGALDVRIETNRLTALGAEAALWLVGGTDPEGRVLLTVARGGLARRFELGFGAGLHFGNGTGIATSARLRVDTPLSALGGYLRYDTAVLLTRPSLAVEQALMLGLELSY
ncbi:MAG: hypothetical protein E6J90_37190, partial [Deltaproteobacteria bacterium]